MREQITKSLERAAATLTPSPNALGVSEITVPVAAGNLDATANEVVTIASRFGGSVTKGLQDSDRMSVLVDLPSNREQEFRAAIASIVGSAASATSATSTPSPPSTTPATAATAEKKSFVVQIVRTAAKRD
jgi:hypothetical protein